MNSLDLDRVRAFVNENIVDFHGHRIKSLEGLKLDKLLRKNPYLFKAKSITTAGELISGLLDAFLSSSEEKLFGDFLERLAVFTAEMTCGGPQIHCAGSGFGVHHWRCSLRHIHQIRAELGQQFSARQAGARSQECCDPSQTVKAGSQCSAGARYMLWQDENELSAWVYEGSGAKLLVSHQRKP